MVHIQSDILPSGRRFQENGEGFPPRSVDIQLAINALSEAEAEERGAIFTRREFVEFILDLVGYIPEKDLSQASLLEPSFGSGDFLLVALQRLLTSFFLHKKNIPDSVLSLKNCLRAVELNKEAFSAVREQVLEVLKNNHISLEDSRELVENWLIRDDFLLTSFPGKFTHIIGNPPYLRQELIPNQLISYYRTLYKTIYDRADLYVPFIERSLSLLAPLGKLSFICSDRWIKNKYGGPLRKAISDNFHLEAYIDLIGVNAFQSDVTVYPAIFLLAAQKGSRTYIAHKPDIVASSLGNLATMLRENHVSNDLRISVSTKIVDGSKPWIISSVDKLKLIRRLEEDFPLLEDDACKVGIGVATGCDRIYIGNADDLPIEADRKLPLLMASDIQNGNIHWNKRYIANPFDKDGTLVKLDTYPLLAQYLLLHEEKIKNRCVAKKNPATWYRTIDKISLPLTYQTKLLIPDIKGEPTVVLDEGNYYPHHNLYYITSTQWDLRALQVILRSPIAKLFVSTYSIKMQGGYLRFQAQYIRRICIPRWEQIPQTVKQRLIASLYEKDKNVYNEVVFEAYHLSQEERLILQQKPDSVG